MFKKKSEKPTILLKPGLGIELVFNINSDKPTLRTSIIFDIDYSKQEVIVIQPAKRISKNFIFQDLHISTLIHDEGSVKKRIGYPAVIIEHLPVYKLSTEKQVPALKIKFETNPVDINIRSAYRYQPRSGYDVLGKLIYENQHFYSGVHFKIFNISITGVGLIIPKLVQKKKNSLMGIKIGDNAKIGLLLKEGTSNKNVITLDSDISIVRKNENYNEKSSFAGASFIDLSPKNETILNRFIHSAQINQIRTYNRI